MEEVAGLAFRRLARASWIALLLFSIPIVALAQRAERFVRVGYLGHTSSIHELEIPARRSPATVAFVDGLAALGWAEGKNIEFVWKSAEGHFERLPALAQELVRARVDVIVTGGVATDAAAEATHAIPIVMTSHGSPVPRLAESLSRPGRNVTGLTQGVGIEVQKQLALLKEALPSIKRVALAVQLQGGDPDKLAGITKQPRFVAAADALGLELSVVWFRKPDELKSMIEGAGRQGAQALLFDDIGVLSYPQHQKVIADEARRHRLLVMHYILSSVDNGGLMAYGRDIKNSMRRTARIVDRILRGAKPAEIPIEQPEGIELHVNLAAAKAIGLQIPASFLLQADRVVGGP